MVKGSFEPAGNLIGELEFTVVDMVGEKDPKTPCKRSTRANCRARR
jgi:hypothetical protein